MLYNLISTPGFYRGLVYIAMAGGITFDQSQENAIIAAGLAVAGLIHAFAASRTPK